jgi:hypothetical protein
LGKMGVLPSLLVLSFLWSIWVEDWSTRKAITVRFISTYPRDVSGTPSGCIAKEKMLWFWKCYGMRGHTHTHEQRIAN